MSVDAHALATLLYSVTHSNILFTYTVVICLFNFFFETRYNVCLINDTNNVKQRDLLLCAVMYVKLKAPLEAHLNGTALPDSVDCLYE